MSGGYSGYMENVQQTLPNVQDCQNADVKNKNTFQIFKKANIHDDDLTVDLDNLQAQGPGLYHLDNQYGCECGLK